MVERTQDGLINFSFDSPASFGFSAMNSTLDFNLSFRAQLAVSTPIRISAEYRPMNLDGGSTRVNITVAEVNIRQRWFG